LSAPADARPPAGAEGVRELLARTPLLVRARPHALAAWPRDAAHAVDAPSAGPSAAPSGAQLAASLAAVAAREPGALVLWCVDEREVTALLPQAALASLPAPASCERDRAVITLDAVMAWDVTGVLAAVSAALALAGIPLGAVTAFSRDHLLGPRARLPDALAALSGLCGEVRHAPDESRDPPVADGR
jgi:hypothetical protein